MQIPGLVSLKRHPNVVFVGIDTLDDIRNNSYNELFASGGCIVSDEFVLSPEFITPGGSGAATPSGALGRIKMIILRFFNGSDVFLQPN